MDPKAVEKAAAHYARALEAFAYLAAARSFADFEKAWSSFLGEYGRVLSKLEAGAKANPQSRQWYGQFKHECRNDPLASYLLQARNAEEHGLLDTTKQSFDPNITPSTPSQTPPTISMFSVHGDGTIETREINVSSPDAKYFSMGEIDSLVELATVFDERFPGQSWPRPTQHNGADIENQTPVGIALLGMNLLEEAIAQARSHIR